MIIIKRGGKIVENNNKVIENIADPTGLERLFREDPKDFKKDFAEAYFNRANTYTKLLDMKKACTDIKESAKLGYTPAIAHITNLCN